MINVTVKHSSVGPAHDPYARAEYEAEVDGKHVKLTCCSFAGTKLEIEGVETMIRFFDDSRTDRNEPITKFEQLVGRTLDEIEEDYNYDEDPMGHPSQYE